MVDVVTLKESLDIVEIVSEVVLIKKNGKDYFGLCPFHSEQDGSFSVSAEKQMFYCFGCGAGGDVFEFWCKYQNISFGRALRELAAKKGMVIDGVSNQRTPKMPKESKWQPAQRDLPDELIDPDLWKEKAGKFVAWGYGQLFETPGALDFLKSRGITEEPAGRFGLGWNTGRDGKDLFRPRESWGLSKLISDKGKPRRLWLPMGLVIPWISRDGTVSRIRIRRDGENLKFGPRYYVVPGSNMGTMLIKDSREKAQNTQIYIIVESELDGVLLTQEVNDFCGVVALGSSSAKPDRDSTGILKDAAYIMVALDSDKAGTKAWQWWKKEFPDCARWPVPKGKDPGEAWQAGVNLRDWVIAGLPEGLR